MGWIAPKKGYGLDSPHQQKYGLDRLDSPKERIWADSPKEDVDSPKCRLKLEFYDTFSSGGMFLSIENAIEKHRFFD